MAEILQWDVGRILIIFLTNLQQRVACSRRPVADEGADILCPSVERLSVRDVNMDGSCLQALAQVTACTMQSSLRRIYIVHI